MLQVHTEITAFQCHHHLQQSDKRLSLPLHLMHQFLQLLLLTPVLMSAPLFLMNEDKDTMSEPVISNTSPTEPLSMPRFLSKADINNSMGLSSEVDAPPHQAYNSYLEILQDEDTDCVPHASVNLPTQPQHDMEEEIPEEPCVLIGGINISIVTSCQIDGLDPALIPNMGSQQKRKQSEKVAWGKESLNDVSEVGGQKRARNHRG